MTDLLEFLRISIIARGGFPEDVRNAAQLLYDKYAAPQVPGDREAPGNVRPIASSPAVAAPNFLNTDYTDREAVEKLLDRARDSCKRLGQICLHDGCSYPAKSCLFE